MIQVSMENKENSLEIWDDKVITALLIVFLVASTVLLFGVLYVAFWR